MSKEEVDQLTRMIASLDAKVTALMRREGLRLTRDQVCQRIGVHRNTLATMIKDKRFPAPIPDGHWLEATVVEWETLQQERAA